MSRSHFAFVYSLVSVCALACSAVSRAVVSAVEHTAALVREALDLFSPDPPRVAPESWEGGRSLQGQSLPAALLQSLRYESPSGFAASR